MKITANEARLRLAEIEIKFLQGTIRKQREWAKQPKRRRLYFSDMDFDAELELTGYQAVGAAGDYWEIPNI